MMNMRNLGSKESTGVKFKDSIYAKLWLKLRFESLLNSYWRKLDGCFFHRYGFKSDSPEKFWTNTSIGWKSNCPETRYRILDNYLQPQSQ